MMHGILMYMWLIVLFTIMIVVPLYMFGLLCLIVVSVIEKIQSRRQIK